MCTHTCFLLDKMHIQPPFKNAKDPTLKKYMNAILQNNYMHMNWCKKKNHCYMCMILLSQLFLNYSEYVHCTIWYSYRVYCQGNFDLSNFHHDFKRSYCFDKK